MKHTTYPLIEFRRHLLLKNTQGNLVIDTGSPVSFHEDGIIELGDCKMNVSNSLNEKVNSRYLNKNIGIEIKGLLGMDFMGKYATVFNTRKFGGFISFDEELFYGTDAMESFSIAGCPGIVMKVNGMSVRMLVDSGAPLSYIDEKFFKDATFVGRKKDFYPMLETDVFFADTFELPCHIGCGNHKDKDLKLVFGLPPTDLGLTLRQIGVDGLIGYDLFRNFRISLEKGQVVLPPQGI